MNVRAIVPAAGSGTRFGACEEYVELGGGSTGLESADLALTARLLPAGAECPSPIDS